MKEFQYFSENPENINIQKMWKSLKKICPKVKPILPCAKQNHKGKNLLSKEYKN